MPDLKQVVNENFSRYAGNVILDRAITDVRDLLKPSARMILYSQYKVSKNVSDKPFIKSARVVGDALGHFYTHGDSSCYSTYMRMAKPFAMRYPLEDCQGNSGTIAAGGDEAASRYTELRLSPLGTMLFKDIDKETISEWSPNFDETEDFPKILPSKGFYNIVNGTTGIGIATASSIPQFNLKEINKAMVELIKNPEYEVNILPDFATGAILLNEKEVLESLKNGCGAACRLRAVIDYNKEENSLVVKEIPYGVYTSTILKQIKELVETNPNCGIVNANDSSSKTPDLYIYLDKNVSINKVLELLYKETSLQSYFSINMTVLKDGKKPVVMGLKDLLMEHINHERQVYYKGYEYDLNKIEKRLHILDGLLICLAQIDEVIKVIKTSSSTLEASINLQKNFLLSEVQSKAILDMKLSRLSKLEVKKIEKEKADLEKEREVLQKKLTDPKLLDADVIKGLNDVAAKFGDERRTKVLNLSRGESEKLDKEVIVVVEGDNTVKAIDPDKLRIFNKGTKGTNLSKEGIVDVVKVNVDDSLFIYDKNGAVNELSVSMIPVVDDIKEKGASLSTICSCKDVAKVLDWEDKKYFISVTKKGIVKRCLTEDVVKRNGAKKDIKIKENDELMDVLFANDGDNLVFVTDNNKFLNVPVEDYKLSSPSAVGAKGASSPILSIITAAKDDKILTYTKDGKGKFSYRYEFAENSKLNMGSVLCDNLIGVARINSGKDDGKVFISSVEGKCITIEANSISHFSPKATGGKLYNGEIQKIVSLNSSK